MQVYKVVYREEDTPGCWSSATIISSSKYLLSYGIGKTTDPRFGSIFAFETIEDALNFRNTFVPLSRYDILICHAVVDKEASDRGLMTHIVSDFDLFWESPEECPSKAVVPVGTVICTSLITLSVWKEGEHG